MIDKPFGIVSIIIFFIFMFFLPIFLNFTPTPLGSQLIEVFLIPAFVIFSIWILFGMSGLKYKFVYIPLLLLLLIQFTFSYKGNNKSKSFAAYDYGYNLIQSIDKNSTAFLEGDNLVFPVAYLCKIEKILPKGKIYDETGNVLENIYGKNFMQLDKNTHDMILRKVQSYFIDNTITYFTLGTQLANMYENKFIPYGILYQILSKYESHSPSYLWRKYNLRSLYKPDDNDYMYRDLVCLFNYWFFEYKNDKNVLENIMSISFDNESIFTNIANLFLRKQDYKEAEKYYKLSISINPYSPSNYYNLAYCYTKQNMFDKAIDMYSHALRINKKYVQAWIGIANAYVEKGDTSNALSSLSNALAIEPRNAKVHYNIGVIYANQGDLEKAVHYFHRALEYDPNYTKAANALEQAIKIMNKQK
jgi:tetratricopeptide (TPR) repeat protein